MMSLCRLEAVNSGHKIDVFSLSLLHSKISNFVASCMTCACVWVILSSMFWFEVQFTLYDSDYESMHCLSEDKNGIVPAD